MEKPFKDPSDNDIKEKFGEEGEIDIELISPWIDIKRGIIFY